MGKRLSKEARAEVLNRFVGRRIRVKSQRETSGIMKGCLLPGFTGVLEEYKWDHRVYVLRISTASMTRWAKDRNVPVIQKAYQKAKDKK